MVSPALCERSSEDCRSWDFHSFRTSGVGRRGLRRWSCDEGFSLAHHIPGLYVSVHSVPVILFGGLQPTRGYHNQPFVVMEQATLLPLEIWCHSVSLCNFWETPEQPGHCGRVFPRDYLAWEFSEGGGGGSSQCSEQLTPQDASLAVRTMVTREMRSMAFLNDHCGGGLIIPLIPILLGRNRHLHWRCPSNSPGFRARSAWPQSPNSARTIFCLLLLWLSAT